MNQDLINRYTYAVTSKLPEQQRADIERELRGLIIDMLEERTAGSAPTDADLEAVLMELGNPAELADKYRGYQRALIGPALLPTYLTILKIVEASIALAMLIVFIITTISDPTRVLGAFANALTSLIFAGLQGFGVVTLIFALIEFGIARDGLKRPERQWKPADLPSVPEESSRIKRLDPILHIIMTVIFTALFTFSIELFGVWNVGTGQAVTVAPFFDPAVFNHFIPYIWAAVGVDILAQIYKLMLGRWTLPLIALEAFASLVQFFVALFLFADGSIWNPNFLTELARAGVAPLGSDFYNLAGRVWVHATTYFIYFIGLVVAIQLVVLAVQAVRLLVERRR